MHVQNIQAIMADTQQSRLSICSHFQCKVEQADKLIIVDKSEFAMSSMPAEPTGRPSCQASSSSASAVGLPPPIRLPPPPAPKAQPVDLMQTVAKGLPMKGPPAKAPAVIQRNQIFTDMVAMQEVPAAPGAADPHGIHLFCFNGRGDTGGTTQAQ